MEPTVSLAVAAIIFGVSAYFTRARRRRILLALVGGVVFAAGNIGWDALARRMDWWHDPGGARPLWYVAAAVAFSGVGLIAWRIDRRSGTRGLVWFFLLFALYGLARDFAIARFRPEMIVFGGGVVPWLVDYAAWLTLAAFAVAVQMVIEPDSGAERLRSH